jgi:putative endopeptidase
LFQIYCQRKIINTEYKNEKISLVVIFVATVVSSCFATIVDGKSIPLQSSGIKLENLDTTVTPGDDFYEFAGGSWLKNNPLTGEYASFYSFDKLEEETRQQLKSLTEDLSSKQNAKGSIEQKIVDLYKTSMDSDKLNAEGAKPVEKDLALVRNVTSKDQLASLMANLQRLGVNAYWMFGVWSDPMQSSMNILHLCQGGIGMGERGYYFDNDASTRNIRKKYEKHVTKMFTLFGFKPTDAKKAAATVIRIENDLAKAAYPKEKTRIRMLFVTK